MKIQLDDDIAEEITKRLQNISESIERMKKEMAEKDKKILELENKLKQFT